MDTSPLIRFPQGTRVLVTGGAGFIGSHLVEALLTQGCRVRCLDDLSTGSRENVTLFQDREGYQFLQGDVKSLDTCLEACQDQEYVLHEAAWGSVPRSLERPLFYSENNIQGTLNMLEAARRQKVRRFVYASSSSVYGDAPGLPKREGQEGNPLSPYALTKQDNERWAAQYTRHFGLPTIGLRYFNVFGSRQNPQGPYAAVLPRFVQALQHNEAPVIYGDGRQSRDFTHVDNVVLANLLALQAGEAAWGKAVNVACGEAVTLLEALEQVGKILGRHIPPRHLPPRPGDVRHSLADLEAARILLGYQPVRLFAEGLEKTIAWYAQLT